MSDTVTKRMLALYREVAPVSMFLQSLFSASGRSFFMTKTVELDIIRNGRSIAIPVPDLSSDYNHIARDLSTNKEFLPPIYKEAAPINASDLLDRMPGQDPFQQPDIRGNIIFRALDAIALIAERFNRAKEVQASQILQTATLDLINDNGDSVYTLDFKGKDTHFPTAAIDWDSGTAVMAKNLIDLATVINTNGKRPVNQAIFGANAWFLAMENDDFRALFSERRLDQGTVVPMRTMDGGGQYRGVINVGNYLIDCWTYNDAYDHPETGTNTFYVDTNNVILRAATGDLRSAFGLVPNIGKLLGAKNFVDIPEIARISDAAGLSDLQTIVWLSENGENLFAGVASRPILFPAAIDTFGCLQVIA